MAYISSSEDEFPDIEIIARRHKKKACKEPDGENEDTPRRSGSLKLAQTGLNKNNGKTPATTRRIRKLDQSQPVDRSLLKPWQGSERDREIGSNASSSRQPSWAQNGREEIKDAQSGNLLDRLPATTKRGECRVVSSGTVFDSPPKERKTTRRLITRGEKKALDSKSTQKAESRAESSDESESETESYDENDDSLSDEDDGSDFILGGNSDSDDLSMTPPSHSQSPSGPRRMQRRVLHPPNVTIKKEPTRTNPKMDDPVTSSRKQPEKRNAPKVSTTKQLKAAPKGKLEDAFEKLKIFNEESEEEPVTRDSKTQTTEPMTPRKNLTASPAKVPRIPMSPWKPEHKEFWDPEVNFAWIDQHSPPKKSTKGAAATAAAPPSAADNKEELRRKYGTSPEKKQAKKAFDSVKEDLARAFLAELDEVVTGGRLARLTASTGGLRLEWSNTLLTTAGRAHWKCKTTTTTSRQPSASSSGAATTTTTMTTTKTTAVTHYASIELATKVLANESDLLNTVAHEFCHLAVFLLHGKPKLAHGAEFKTYGRRVMAAAAASVPSSTPSPTSASAPASASTSASTSASVSDKSLKTPRARGVEINVTTRHSYEIEYRFVWRCADCGGEVSRHSRSVDPTRVRCGRCKRGVLVQVKPVPRGGGAATLPAPALTSGGDAGTGMGVRGGGGGGATTAVAKVQKTEKKKTAYQEFTSREMKALSVSHKGLSFKDKMALVSARWSEHQKLAKAKATTDATAGVSVKGLAAAVEVLEI